MALAAFYNLKDKKKKNILEAISFCLRSKSYDDLSVNDIVVAADISRGSFYNYFNDKSDAVSIYVESRIKDYLDLYIKSVSASEFSLIEGTRKIYDEIKDILKNEINALKLKNLKFFIEFVIQSIHTEKFEKDIDSVIEWLVENTVEGKSSLNSSKKMANTLDILIMIVLATIFNNIVFKSEYFEKYDDLNYKLNLIKNGI